MVTDAVCESRVNKIHDEINLLRETTNANAIILKGVQKSVIKIDHSLNGNGRKGFFERYAEDKTMFIVVIIIIATGGAGSGVAFFRLLKGLIL